MSPAPTRTLDDWASSLALACVQPGNAMLLVRAATWHEILVRVGQPAPFFAVHDLGLLFVADPRAAPIARPSTALPHDAAGAHETWERLLLMLSTSEVIERARGWRLTDELVAVLLLRIFGAWSARGDRGTMARAQAAPRPLDPARVTELVAWRPTHGSAAPRKDDLDALRSLAGDHLKLATAVEQVDLDTLRLVGMLGAEGAVASAIGLVDLLAALEDTQANDIVNFSLDLLPSILETRRSHGEQTFNVDGYAGLARRGTLDALMFSELAFDDDTFAHRLTENELLYYAREKQHEEDRRTHYIVIDASASMRGERGVFARGLALGLAKKLLLRGEEVLVRFFDSRLHDVIRARPSRASSSLNVPYLLSFRGERGRNYRKVFELLEGELARLARREPRPLVLHVITHAECHVPVELVERLRRHATLHGVFLLPSTGELALDYLDLLDSVEIVDAESVHGGEQRTRRALGIVERAGRPPRSAGARRA